MVRFFIPPVLHVCALVASAFAVPTSRSTSAPQVTLDYGTFQGFSSAGDTESFLGMPFAQPPVGQLRFNNPVPPQPFSGVRDATQFGNACPQQPALPGGMLPNNPAFLAAIPFLAPLLAGGGVGSSEDCLYLNVVRPAGISSGAKLPVVVWIFGGAFANGDASPENGTQIVSRSLDLTSPVIYVSFNYRLNAFGFLGGKEVKDAGLGNFGLLDQRLALEWVQKYISLFGGDSERVILWGQSAGAISVMLQMVGYGGQLNGLFHGAVMESGSTFPIFDITIPAAQNNYDLIVEQTNCGSASNTLDCLRQAPYQSILDAVLQTPTVLSYQGSNNSWGPLVDGSFLTQTIRQSVRQGSYARVPVVFGDVDDEGTLFSLFSLNVTTNDQFLQYIQSIFLVGATQQEIQTVGTVYPDDPTLGSPYGVGTSDEVTPEYKRIASFQGDLFFQSQRRFSLKHLSLTQNTWSYLWKREKDATNIGSFHGSDLQEYYNILGNSDFIGADLLVNLAYNLNPNAPRGGYGSGAASSLLSNIHWPPYVSDDMPPQVLTIGDSQLTLSDDTYRGAAMAALNAIQTRLGW